MQPNPRINGYLARALSHELNVVQHYLTQACLCELWGLRDRAEALRRDANDELGHAGLLISRMLMLGFAPNTTQLNPVRPGRDPHEMLVLDHHLEAEAVRMYAEAEHYCRRFRDVETADLFARLRVDEQEHLECIERMLANQRKES